MTRWTMSLLIVLMAAGLAYHLWVVGDLMETQDRLERQLAELRESDSKAPVQRDAGTEDQADASRPDPEVAAPENAGPGEGLSLEAAKARAGQLAGQAKAALADKNGEKFLDAVFAMLDLGEGVYPEILALINELDVAQLNEIYRDLEKGLAGKTKLFGGLLARLPILSGMVAHALKREDGSLDNASMMALSLLTRFQVPMGSDPQMIRNIQGIVESALALKEEGAPRSDYYSFLYLGIDALGKSDTPAAVTALGGLYSRISDRYQHRIAAALSGMTSAESAAMLGKLFQDSEHNQAWRLSHYLASTKNEHASSVLWSLLEADASPDRQVSIWRAIASRPENAEKVFGYLQGEDQDARARMAIISGYDGGTPEKTSAFLWDIYKHPGSESEQTTALQRLVYQGDRQAAEETMNHFMAGSESRTIRDLVPQLDGEFLKGRLDDMAAIASDAARSMDHRVTAAQAVGRFNQNDAVNAIMTGFDGLNEQQQSTIVNMLSDHNFRDAPVVKKALSDIMKSGSTERIRNFAKERMSRLR